MATLRAGFRTGYTLRLEFWFGERRGRQIDVRYEVWVDVAANYTGYWNQNGTIDVWGIDGQPRRFAVSGADFRPGAPRARSFHLASGGGTATYGSDGNYRYATGIIASISDLGRAHPGDGAIDAPYIGPDVPPPPPASIPGAPHSLSVRAGTLTVDTFGVDYVRGAANNSTLVQDQAEWSRVDDGAVVWNDMNPGGYTSPNGGATPGSPLLDPGREYRVRVRSRNGIGWGPWSGYVSTRTLAAARVPKAGSMVRAAQVRVPGAGGLVVARQVRVPKNGGYVNAR